jgi:enoyl-CoA hydratase/carnithine racemase
MADAYEAVTYSVDRSVATITLNRPQVLNAINRTMHQEWSDALDRGATDPDVAVVVIRGAGRAFSAGHDLKQDLDLPLRHPEEWRAALGDTLDLAWKIWDLSKPVVASVHGYCLGKACQLALACDFVLATEDAVFGEPEVRQVTTSAFPILPWLVGLRKAKEMLMLGRTVTGREAERIGMINAACSPDSLGEQTWELAGELAAAAPAAIRLNKRAINHAVELMGLRTGSQWNLELLSLTVAREFEVEASTDFDRTRREQGVKAAIRQRDKVPDSHEVSP